MAKKEITVTFRTITPLWTGDAWQNNGEIRPSSLIGSLRFWFAFYWKVVKNGTTEKLNENGIPKESLSELENPKANKTFKAILKNKIIESINFDEAIDKTLEELGLSVPSRIFGCTGWKSRIKIKIAKFSARELNFDDVETEFPLNKLQNANITSEFWIKRSLFANKKIVKGFDNIELKLNTTEYWWNNYLKDFFSFFKDKIILIGGKKSFGFGLVNITIGRVSNNVFNGWNNYLKLEKISPIQYNRNKKVLGFNFKYFLRKRENKNFRSINFGEQGQASKVYVSHLLENSEKYIYLLVLNSPFDEIRKIPPNVINKYKNWLNELSNSEENNG